MPVYSLCYDIIIHASPSQFIEYIAGFREQIVSSTLSQMSLQEMGDRLADESSKEHGSEIQSLLQNIDTLRLSLDHVTKRLSGYQ